MNKYCILIIICAALISCRETNKTNTSYGYIIDTNIKSEVQKNISSAGFDSEQDIMSIYNNRMILDSYSNDKLEYSITEKDEKSTIFKSFYYWKNDTLGIDGAFGLFGGIGFSIKIINGKAKLYHMLSADDFPYYAYEENDDLIFRLEVPCKETEIILSEIPDSISNQTIYGYVAFKSDNYYISSGSADGQEILPRKRQSAYMKIYFKSSRLNL